LRGPMYHPACAHPGQSEKDSWCWLEPFQDAKGVFPTGESILQWRQQGARTVSWIVRVARRWSGGNEGVVRTEADAYVEGDEAELTTVVKPTMGWPVLFIRPIPEVLRIVPPTAAAAMAGNVGPITRGTFPCHTRRLGSRSQCRAVTCDWVHSRTKEERRVE
jgi:hypothetical protein